MAASLKRDDFAAHMSASDKATMAGFDANDWLRQLEAMLTLDIAAPFHGSMSEAARAVKAKVLVVASRQDHMVNPAPALEFAKLLNATLVLLEGDCGHLAPGCEGAKMTPAVQEFLK
jgi:homoserine O-acetyltransferase